MGVISEMEKAIVEVKKDPAKQLIYQQIFAKYPPAFLSDCERSILHTRSMVSEWLASGMFKDEPDPKQAAEKTISALMDYEGTAEHSHHFLFDQCKDMGLAVERLEEDQDLQEDVLSVHHAFVPTFARVPVIKIIQNAGDGIWTVAT